MVDQIPAAQYLRMSTEHQQYSLHSQAAAIERYAEANGFAVVKSYFDPGKSGLHLKSRFGLQQLLRDVMVGDPGFKAILVYDVSRWGRFPDADEAAHYEFVCRQAGFRVYYCAELFKNDDTLPNTILKWMKRAMAAEYSRELSAKVFDAHVRLARLGYKQGGQAGFGLRRRLVGRNHDLKQVLEIGERKAISDDRVILVPGPEYEVRWVREIYRMLLEDGRSAWWIKNELNRQQVQRKGEYSPWSYSAVVRILTHPKYAGFNVYARSTQKLGTRVVELAPSEWVMTPGAYQSIVSQETFDRVQKILRGRTINKTNEELLESLRTVLKRVGRLSQKVLSEAPEWTASTTLLRDRFGSLQRAFAMIGYGKPEDYSRIDQRRRGFALRDQLLAQIEECFPDQVRVVQHHPLSRIRLRLNSRLLISVCVSRSLRLRSGNFRWYIDPLATERRLTTLLVRLDTKNEQVQDLFVLPSVNRSKLFWIKKDDEWLRRGKRVESVRHLLAVVEEVNMLRRGYSRQKGQNQKRCDTSRLTRTANPALYSRTN